MLLLNSFTTFSDIILGSFLLLTVLSLWSRPFLPPFLPSFLGMVTCVVALVAQRIDWGGITFLALMDMIIKNYYQRNTIEWMKKLLGVLILMMVPLFYLHIIPGFHNLCLINKVRLCADCTPYSLYLNTDKILVGILLLVYGHRHLNRHFQEWRRSFQVTFIPLFFVVFVLLIGATFFNYIRVDFKISSLLAPWAVVNLLFVCVAEEVFFRGFLQKELSHILHPIKGGAWIALGIASILFGLAHYQGGVTYIALATLAGAGYGFVYQRSGQIESPIFLHFLVNLIHFIGFSYPALDPAFIAK